MDYKAAFTTLYGAAGAAVDALVQHVLITRDICQAEKILKDAIASVETMMDDSESE